MEKAPRRLDHPITGLKRERIAGEGTWICNETTRKIASLQNLKTSRERLQNLVEEATMGIVVLTGEYLRVDIVNEAYGKLIGRTPQDLITNFPATASDWQCVIRPTFSLTAPHSPLPPPHSD